MAGTKREAYRQTEGVDYGVARTVREGLIRLAESAYAERLD